MVYFTLFGPVTAYASESADDITGTWRVNPEAPEAITPASLDARVASVETTLESVPAASDVALHTAALGQIRTRYPAHVHGLLGLNGDPMGTDGELDYTLPGD